MPVFPRYPEAEWVPWKYRSPAGQINYYANVMSAANPPRAAVLHIMQGWMTTARQWAVNGHYGASWHFSVGRDGHVMQHLDFEHGGYHAGIADDVARIRRPTWPGWRGLGINVNSYTVGIEHEGMYESPGVFTDAQAEASIKLCRWLAAAFGWQWDQVSFPAHAEIDIRDRYNDFDTPEMRAVHYARMFAAPPTQEVDDVTKDEVEAMLKARDGQIDANAARIERVNDAMVNRMRLHRVADDPDYARVEGIIKAIRDAGYTI